jgi:hypothetical protein
VSGKVSPFIARPALPPTREALLARKAEAEDKTVTFTAEMPASLRDAFKKHAIDRGTTVKALIIRLMRDELNG